MLMIKIESKLSGYSNNIKRKMLDFGINNKNVVSLMQVRSKWRNAIIYVGLPYFMSNWFERRSSVRAKRHLVLTEAQKKYLSSTKSKLSIRELSDDEKQKLYDWKENIKLWTENYINDLNKSNLKKSNLNNGNKEDVTDVTVISTQPVVRTAVQTNDYKNIFQQNQKLV